MPQPGHMLERSLLAGFLLCAVLLTGTLPAAAQTGAPTPLRLETREIERELGTAREELGTLPEGRQAALLQNRINAIEEQLRQLTGRVEEAEFRDRQTQTRIDQLVADLDRRLAALEDTPADGRVGQGPLEHDAEADTADGAPSAGGVDGDLPTPEVMIAIPAETAAEREPAIEADRAAREGFVLGTIPRDALIGVPRPSGEAPSGTAPAAALEGNASSRFSAALDLLQTGDYDAAAVAFDRWVGDFPEDPQAPVASFWLGEAQLAQGELADAAATFAANYRTFGAEAPRAADNLLKLGSALAAMGDTSRACQTFAEMDRRYPGAGSALRQALERERRAAGCT